MALNGLGLGFLFYAKDQASATINALDGRLGNLDRRVGSTSEGLRASAMMVGSAGLAITGAGAGIIAGGIGLAEMSGEFTAQIAKVGGIAQSSAEDLMRLHNAALAARKTGFAPLEAAEGLEALASAGFDATESIAALTPVLDLARAGSISVGNAATALSSAMNIFGTPKTSQAIGLVADQFVRISNSTNVAAGDLVEAMAGINRGAITAGAGIEELLPALALVRNTGAAASVSAHAVSTAVESMAAHSDKFKAIGVSVTDPITHGFRPVLDIIQETQTQLLQRFPDAAQRGAKVIELFGKFGKGAFDSITTAIRRGFKDSLGHIHRGEDAVRFLREEMLHAAGAAALMRDRMLDTFAGQKQILGASVVALGTVLGEGFERAFRPLVEIAIKVIDPIIDFLMQLPVEARGAMAKVVLAFGGGLVVFGLFVTAAAAVVLLLPLLEALAGAAATVAVGFGIVGVALLPVIGLIAGANSLLMHNVGGSLEVLQNAFGKVKLAFQALVQLFTQGGFSGAVDQELQRAENHGIERFAVNVYSFVHRITQFFRGIGQGFSAALDTLGPVVDRFLGALTDLGAAFGFVGDSVEGVATTPSSKFLEMGAKIGMWLAKLVEWAIDGATVLARLGQGFIEGARAASQHLAPTFHKLGTAFGKLWEQIKKVLVAVGAMSESGASTSQDWVDLGGTIGEFVVGAFGMLVKIITFVVKLVTILVEAFNWLRMTGIKVGIAIASMGTHLQTFFENLGDTFSNMIDGIIVKLGELASHIPAGIRPGFLNDLMGEGQAAQGRIAGRTVAMGVRSATADAVDAYSTSRTLPAMGDADQRAENARMQRAALDRVGNTFTNQQRAAGPFNVTLQVDGESIMRATARAERSDRAASFTPGDTATPWSEG